jgi:hypothetical protein
MKFPYSTFSLLIWIASIVLTSACSKENQADAENQGERRAAKVQFSCGTAEYQGKTVPATIINNSQQGKPLTAIYWDPVNNRFGEKWTPQVRCQEVSQRFQKIYDRDGLKYITADEAKWINQRTVNVICSVKSEGDRCAEDDLLITLETKDDPNEVLQDLIAFRKSPTTKRAITRGKNNPTSFAEGKRVYYDITTVVGEVEPTQNSEEKSAF